MDNWTIAHASCTMTQPPSLVNCVNILAAPCRIRVANFAANFAANFLANPHNGLEETGVANFLSNRPLEPTLGTSLWPKCLVGVLQANSLRIVKQLCKIPQQIASQMQDSRAVGAFGLPSKPNIVPGQMGCFRVSFPTENAITRRMTKY